MPSILVFVVLPRTYVVPQTGCYSNFKSFTLSFSKHVELAYEKKKNRIIFYFCNFALFVFTLFTFIYSSLSRLVFITKLAPLSKEIWDVYGRFVFLL